MRTGLCEHSSAKFLTQIRNYRKTYVRIKQKAAWFSFLSLSLFFLVTDLSDEMHARAGRSATDVQTGARIIKLKSLITLISLRVIGFSSLAIKVVWNLCRY